MSHSLMHTDRVKPLLVNNTSFIGSKHGINIATVDFALNYYVTE